jgi:serine/threonine protein kinase
MHRVPQSLQASPAHRPYTKGDVLDIVTLNYRAPELLFGDVAFGAHIDVWALGIVVLQAAGCRFHMKTDAKEWTPEVMVQLLFKQLGVPSSVLLRALPFFPSGVDPSPAGAWPEQVRATLGTHGIAFVDSALAWEPLARPRASELVKHDFFKPPMMTLGGMIKDSCGAFVASGPGPFPGVRCPWNILHGDVGPDVLAYLQGDPA